MAEKKSDYLLQPGSDKQWVDNVAKKQPKKKKNCDYLRSWS